MDDSHPKGTALWRSKVQEMMKSASLTRRAETAFEIMGAPDERFTALVLLEERIKADPKRAHAVDAIRKKRDRSFNGLQDRFRNELYIQSTIVFDWCTPKEHQSHVFWVPISTCIFSVIFMFMAGAYPLHVQECTAYGCSGLTPCVERWMVTPRGIGHWLTFGNFWCLSSQAWTFDATYLTDWGARVNSLMRHDSYRWLTYAFLHTGFPHFLSNVLLWMTAGWRMERRYGSSRFFALWLISSVLGDLFGAVCEDKCVVNVGFSTGICGVVGLFLVDSFRNWRDTDRPLLRFSMFGLLLLAFLATFFLQRGRVSNFSHLGGFLCGLIPSLLFQHHLGHEKLDIYFVPVAVFLTLFLVIFLPTYFYSVTYPASQLCPS